MTKLSKTDLVEVIADQISLPQRDVRAIIDNALSLITDAVGRGDSVSLYGFGSFYPRVRAARIGRNPATGAVMTIAAGTTPGFKASKKGRR